LIFRGIVSIDYKKREHQKTKKDDGRPFQEWDQ